MQRSERVVRVTLHAALSPSTLALGDAWREMTHEQARTLAIDLLQAASAAAMVDIEARSQDGAAKTHEAESAVDDA